MKRVFGWILLSLAALVPVLVLVIALFDWNALRDELAAFAGERIGREVRILGDLDVALGMTTRVRAEDVRIANAGWASPEPFLAMDAIEIAIDVGAALRGRVRLPAVVIERPRLRLARNAAGDVNWAFALGGETGGDLPAVGDVVVRGGETRYDDPALGETVDATLDQLRGSLTPDERLRISGRARVEELPASVELEARPVAPGEGWHADATVRLGTATLAVSGTLGRPDLRLTLDAEDLSRFDVPPLAGLPPTPPVRVETRFTRDEEHWLLDDLRASVGARRLNGDVRIDLERIPPMVWATLYLDRLPLPDAAPKEPAAPVIPDTPIPTEALSRLDLRANLRIGAIDSESLPARDVRLSIRLKDGRLTLDPVTANMADGRIEGRWVLDASRAPPASTVHLRIEQPRLDALLPKRAADLVEGRTSGRIDLRGTGDTLRALLANANGQIVFVMREGALSNRMVELAGIDVGEWLLARAAEADRTPIRCGIFAFAVENGTLRARPVVLDTRDSVLTVEGSIHPLRERVDLTLRAHPKDPSALAARAPIRITGPLADPSIAPAAGPLAAQGLAALALGALAGPLAALLPLLEPGLAEDRNCSALLAGAPAVPAGDEAADREEAAR